jgi:predicted AAA+ superfamily ATPase
MSLLESGESNGGVSLNALFRGIQNEEGIISTLTIEKLAFVLCRGGWPATIHSSALAALRMATDYVEAVIYHDLTAVDGVTKNPDLVRLILRSLARNISNTANYKTLAKDIEAHDKTVSDPTIASYINGLKRIYLVEDLPAWQPSVRSKSAIRTSDKRHFVDPSIATAVMRLSPEGLFEDFNYFGFLFESLCVRDLRIYAQHNDGEVFHYRDSTGLEVDLIVRLKNGKWGAIEVKMGQKEIEKAAAQLLKFKDKIDTQKMGSPSFLMILTAGEYGYLRPDGIWVVPIGALKN